MFIEKVYPLNLDRCPQRHWAMMASLHHAYVPFEIIERYAAKDGLHYKKTLDVVDAMVADGFPEFQAFYDYESYWQKPKNLCVSWGFLSILRMVVERHETALIIEDDTHLRQASFYRLCDVCKSLPNLEMIYLDSFAWKDADPDVTRDEYMVREKEYRQTLKPTQYSYIQSHAYGMGSRARVFTPDGAQRFLKESLKRPWSSSENVGWYMREDGEDMANHYIWYNTDSETRATFTISDLRFIGE